MPLVVLIRLGNSFGRVMEQKQDAVTVSTKELHEQSTHGVSPRRMPQTPRVVVAPCRPPQGKTTNKKADHAYLETTPIRMRTPHIPVCEPAWLPSLAMRLHSKTCSELDKSSRPNVVRARSHSSILPDFCSRYCCGGHYNRVMGSKYHKHD